MKLDKIHNFAGRRFFIPISIGNHYYSNKILTRILSEVTVYSDESIFFICDQLRCFVYKARGEYDDEMIRIKVEREVEQLKRTFVNCGIDKFNNVRIETFSFLQNKPLYSKTLSTIEKICNSDKQVSIFLEKLVLKLANKFFHRATNHILYIQRRYIIEETALSLFMTELCGYNIEIYQCYAHGLIDFLYDKKTDDITILLDKQDLERIFISLEELFSSND